MKSINVHTNWLPNLMENMFLEAKLNAKNNYETFSNPKVNIQENLTNFVIDIAVPGLKKDSLSIEIEEDTLKIASLDNKEEPRNEKEEKEIENGLIFNRKEFNYGNFKKTFKIPENIKIDDVFANYENGVLRISLPKMEEKKALKKMVEIS